MKGTTTEECFLKLISKMCCLIFVDILKNLAACQHTKNIVRTFTYNTIVRMIAFMNTIIPMGKSVIIFYLFLVSGIY